jgi:predicted AlkP superfamily phosphohydrolase/phosphomutase
LPGGLRQRLTPLRDRTQRTLQPQRTPNKVAFDPSVSRCFPVHIGFPVGGIRLNLKGREPRGTLARGAEADAFCEQLMRELHAVIDPNTGQPLVRDVWRTADRFHGDRLDELPDLLVEWSDAIVLGGRAVGNGEGATVQGTSPRIGVVAATNRYCRSGEHRLEGMFIVHGPRIAAGRLDRASSILDIAPTIARSLDCSMVGAEGHVIAEATCDVMGRSDRC